MIKIHGNQNYFKTLGMGCVVAVFFLFLGAIPARQKHSNNGDDTVVAPDSTFAMRVSREGSDVLITLAVRSNCNFESIEIERKADFEQAYSKCRVIDREEVVKKGGQIIKKDNYPFPAQTNVLYRLRLIAKDGVERTYSPILLPGIN